MYTKRIRMKPFRCTNKRVGKAPTFRCMVVLFLSAVWAIGLSVSPALGQHADDEERILFYGSKIDIETDGRLSVTETIKVRSLARDIKHGIYRAIPTKYRGNFMESVTIPLEVTTVLRDGTDEPYFLQEEDNGTVIYIGDEHRDLPAGDHTYTITYTMDQQVGFFDDHDEIYWNVTGSGWKFRIDSVSAVVTLPPGGKIIKENMSAYSGASGEVGCHCEIVTLTERSAAFYTTGPLNPYEGVTVAVPFQKGLIDPPVPEVVMERLIADNYPGMVALTGLCIVLAYYIIAWLMVGKDPRGRTIMLRVEPPPNLTPYELRYITKMKFDKKAMVACLVSMAQNGYLSISESQQGTYTLTRNDNSGNTPTPVETKILDHLFGKGPSIMLTNSYNPSFVSAMNDLKDHLKKNFSNSAFRLNRPWLVVGILASVVVTVFSTIQHPVNSMIPGLFLLVWISGWTFGCYMLIKGFVASIRERKHTISLALLFFAIPFLAAEIFVVTLLADLLNFYALASTLLLVMVNVVFFDLMKAPTAHGRQLLDEIEGFSRFLSTAGMPRAQSQAVSPQMDLNLFQRYLPYALALDVQTAWADHFENLLSAPEQSAPIRWYSGTSFPRSLGEFSSSLNSSLSSTISSSSTRPGSSSGSSGGGSSGGGGGGGGGGGW